MLIVYRSNDLKQTCLQERRMQKELGAKGAKKLKGRLSDLAAAARVTDLVAGHPHPLKGDRRGQFAVSLDGGRRLVFEPANEPVPQHEDGSVDWSHVTAVRIVFIGDYHD